MKKHLMLILAALVICGEEVDAQVSAGYFHSLFRCSSGEVIAVGNNSDGRLGDGTTTDRYSPIQVSGLTGVTAIAAGYFHSLFLKNDGTVWACGRNFHGQLGDGTTMQRLIPIQVSGLSGIIAVAAGASHSLFLKNDGTVWACGYNDRGQLGDGTGVDKYLPVQVNGLIGITALVAGQLSSLFLKNDGTVWTCGDNTHGQLGDGTTAYSRTPPVQVSGLTGIIAVTTGEYHSLFLKNDGTVWACGDNSYGQYGDGTTIERHTPIQVSGLTGITAVAAGTNHSLFLKNDSTVWVCGDNDRGQLGDGTRTRRTSPIQVTGLFSITYIAAGYQYSFFLKNDGTVWACGYNSDGQLGDGTVTDRYLPVQAQNLCMVSLNVSTIVGFIKTAAGVPIPGVTLTLSGHDNQTMTTTTDGIYSFTVASDGNYTITPSKSNDSITNNGVTLIDVLLMRRHLLGMEALPSPYKIIAAAEVNADGDTTITTQDILFTRSLILGNITSFPTNRLWQFVSSDYVFPDTQHPFPFDKTRTYTNITSNQTNQDFIGIKLGDGNGSWDGNIP